MYQNLYRIRRPVSSAHVPATAPPAITGRLYDDVLGGDNCAASGKPSGMTSRRFSPWLWRTGHSCSGGAIPVPRHPAGGGRDRAQSNSHFIDVGGTSLHAARLSNRRPRQRYRHLRRRPRENPRLLTTHVASSMRASRYRSPVMRPALLSGPARSGALGGRGAPELSSRSMPEVLQPAGEEPGAARRRSPRNPAGRRGCCRRAAASAGVLPAGTGSRHWRGVPA